MNFEEILKQFNVETEIKTFDQTTKTAQDAANALECDVAQIAKSIIFRNVDKDEPVLVITSGRNRVNEEKLKESLGDEIGKADADFVKTKTGFPIGGVPGFGHIKPVRTFIDKDLLVYPEVWSAAGTSHSVFKIPTQKLIDITKAEIINVK